MQCSDLNVPYVTGRQLSVVLSNGKYPAQRRPLQSVHEADTRSSSVGPGRRAVRLSTAF
ncbi:hypothetical protein FAIPA1_380026 [Frankia sp. AiPs1]